MFAFNRTQDLMSQLLGAVKPATRHVRVRAIYTLSPRMYRVVFTGAAATNLTDLAEAPPNATVKLIFPHRCAGNGRTLGRAYTIRCYHTTRGELEVGFVAHGETPAAQHGPTARWLEHAAPGDEVEFAGPKRNFRADPTVPWMLLIGDETALSAVFAILETLPEHAQVLTYIAIDGARAQLPLEGALATHPRSHNTHQVESDTIHTGAMMVGALSAQVMPAGTPQVFPAGEALLLEQVRTLLEGAWAVPHDAIDTKGYWTAGLSHEERKASGAC